MITSYRYALCSPSVMVDRVFGRSVVVVIRRLALNGKACRRPARRPVLGGLAASRCYTPAPSAETAAWRKGSGFALCIGRALSFALGLVRGRIERPRLGAAQKKSFICSQKIRVSRPAATPITSMMAVPLVSHPEVVAVAVAIFTALAVGRLLSRNDEP